MTPAEYGSRPAFHRSDVSGMTYREWLIGQALAGLMADHHHTYCGEPLGDLRSETAEMAIGNADAVLAALAAEQESD